MSPRHLLLCLALFGTLGGATASRADDYTDTIAAWRERRTANLVAADGWLALIGRHPLPPGEHSIGSAAGNDIRLAGGPARLGRIRRDASDKVTISLADGVDARIDRTDARTAELAHSNGNPDFVRTGTVNFYVMPSGGELFLRVRDSEAERRTKFGGLDWYSIDPQWRFEADWVEFPEPREVSIVNVIGQSSPEKLPGKAVFTHAGRRLELMPIYRGDQLFFIFTDETAGEETYAASRFLYADAPKDGKVIVDFNKAYNPPCAFSPFTTCPLPPKGNQLPIRVTAGEKLYPGPKS